MEEILQHKFNILKKKGNEYFHKKKYSQARKKYTEGINFLGSTHKLSSILFCNRSLTNIKLENYQSALLDIEKCLKIDPLYKKAYFRKANILYFLEKIELSILELKNIKKKFQNDNNILINKNLNFLKKKLREKNFFDCLQYKREIENYNSKTIPVEIDYKGPIIEENTKITKKLIKNLIIHLKAQKRLHKRYLWVILKRASRIFDKEKNINHISFKNSKMKQITICGDIHGQFYDLLNIFKINGYPSEEKPYLFNGDFVDRGSFSVECVILLIIFKIMNPRSMFINRGNHESIDLNKTYGFEGEVLTKYCSNTFLLFTKFFEFLPLGHIIEKKIIILHGGLFERKNIKISDLQKIQRRKTVPKKGLMCDLLWSDPCNEKGLHPSKRGLGVEFGSDISKNFLDLNNLDLLIRSHEVADEGWEMQRGGRVITLFSAPNYCDVYGNKGGFCVVRKNLVPSFRVFESVGVPPLPSMFYAKNSGFYL